MTNNEIITKYYDFCQELKLKFGMDDDCFQMCILDLLETSNPKLNQLDSKMNWNFGLQDYLRIIGLVKQVDITIPIRNIMRLLKNHLNNKMTNWRID